MPNDRASASYLESLFSLKGKTALITGGTRGIGQEIAIALAGAGANIVLVQRYASYEETVRKIKDLWASLNSSSSSSSGDPHDRLIHVVECNMADQKRVGELVDVVTKSKEEGGLGLDIDILVNCAGIQRRHAAENFPDEDWQEIMQVNLNSVWALSRNTGKYMLERRAKCEAEGIPLPPRGKIINIASILSFQDDIRLISGLGGTTVSAYATAKHGVLGLTKALSNDWSSKGININCIAPGYIDTDMNSSLIANPTRARQILERIPAARWGSPSDFAGPAVFLASAASDYVCGEAVVVDGGWMGR